MPQKTLEQLTIFLTKIVQQIEAPSALEFIEQLLVGIDEISIMQPELGECIDSLKIEVVAFIRHKQLETQGVNGMRDFLVNNAESIVARSLRMGEVDAPAETAQESKEDGNSRPEPNEDEPMADYFSITANAIKDRLKGGLNEAEKSLMTERRKKSSHEKSSIDKALSKFEFMHYVPKVATWLNNFAASFETYEHVSNRIRRLMVAELTGVRGGAGSISPEIVAHVFLRISQLVETHACLVSDPREFPADLLKCEMAFTSDCNTSFYLESDLAVREPLECTYLIRSIAAIAGQVTNEKEDPLDWTDVAHVIATAISNCEAEGKLGEKVKYLISETKVRLEQGGENPTAFLVSMTQDIPRILMRAYNIHLLENEIRDLKEAMG
ncbi:MAG: hypothetical protein V7750_15325 [Sneathiella sp.]